MWEVPGTMHSTHMIACGETAERWITISMVGGVGSVWKGRRKEPTTESPRFGGGLVMESGGKK